MKTVLSEEYKQETQELKSQVQKTIQDINVLNSELLASTKDLQPYYHIALTSIYLDQVSAHSKVNACSEKYLNKKNDGSLSSARKSYYNALLECEKALDLEGKSFWDNLDSLNSNQEALEKIQKMNPKRVLNLMNKFNEKLCEITNEYGTNSKYTWALVDLQARYAIIYKNFLNWRELSVNDPMNPYYQENIQLQSRCKEIIQTVSNRLREKYILLTKELMDLRIAIAYQETLKKITNLLNLHKETETAQKTIDSWTALLKREEQLKEKKRTK